MHPYISLGTFEIPTYFLLIIIGLIFSAFFVVLLSKQNKIKPLYLAVTGIYSLLGLLIGSKLFFAISVLPEILQSVDLVSEYPVKTLAYALSGYVFYGGLLGIIFGIIVFSIQFHVPFYKMTNIIIPVIPLAHFFGRLGCFFTGCCYGMEYDGCCCVVFPENSIITHLNDVPRFPVQLLEAFFNLALFCVFLFLIFKTKKKHNMLILYLLIYPPARFIFEFLRGDDNRGVFGIFSFAQWISIFLFSFALYLYIQKRKSYIKN